MNANVSTLALCLIAISGALTQNAIAQGAPIPSQIENFHPDSSFKVQADKLIERAKAGDGAASTPFGVFPGYKLSLVARVKPFKGCNATPGAPPCPPPHLPAEIHKEASDVCIVVEGEAKIIVGGTLENQVEVAPGELQGTNVVSGIEYVVHKGDILNIPPNTAHMTVVPDGGSLLYFLVKIIPLPAK